MQETKISQLYVLDRKYYYSKMIKTLT